MFVYKEQHIVASSEVTAVPVFSLSSYVIAQLLVL